MTSQANQKRIQNIFQMLFEMATGNFTHRISEDEVKDEISTIARILNNMAEEMFSIINKSGYIIPVYTYQSLVQATFFLSKEFQIESFSTRTPEILGCPAEELFNIQFAQIIGENSHEIAMHILTSANKEEDYFNIQQLSFKVANAGLIPHFCTISRVLNSDKIIVSVISTIINDFIDYTTPTALADRPKNAAVIQQLHNYILTHLDTPLPNIKELAKLFGSNTFSLQDGFRYYFNTSIYHFYNEQRLKKAHDLLQQTTLSVKAIGYMTGFNDYPTFYKAFKKYFGYTPSEVFREKSNKNDE